mmetsp:Transcript_70945/g.112124  ORF Transcript_70945/g.112124 Transcript_70945/m.112124 type:complete len:545 (+) Transcript_70945:40-1674(+)
MVMLFSIRHVFLFFCSKDFFCNGASDLKLAHDGKVYFLDESNFSAGVRKYAHTFVKFFAPWCAACTHMAPEWEKMAKMASTFDVPVVKVDVSTESGGNLAQEYDVRSTPTLMLFKGDAAIRAKYTGHRDMSSMSDWLGYKVEGENVALPEPTEEGLKKEWAPHARLKLLGLQSGGAGDTDLEVLVEALAFSLNPNGPGADIPVASVSLPTSEMDKLGISCPQLPCLVLLRDYEFEDNKVATFVEKDSTLKISTRIKLFMDWLDPLKMPVLIPAADDTEHLFLREHAQQPGNAVAMYFGSDAEVRRDIHKLAVEFAPSEPQLKWVHAVPDEFGQNLASMVGVDAADFPDFVIWEFGKAEDDDRIYRFLKQSSNADAEFPDEGVEGKVRTFVERYKSKSLEPEKDPVLEVTSKTFEDEVIKASSDVLVEFYAPWCGHCKALAPEYKQVARHYSKDDQIKIVKVDATVHSHSSVDVKSFPTLMFYTALDKKKPITLKFEASRDRHSIIELVEKHRSTSATCAAGDESCAKASQSAPDDDDDDDFPDF